MKVPTCPEHGNLVLDLARGRLNDADAEDAELVRGSCPRCAGWWNTTFADRAIADVDRAVAESFANFSPVTRRRWWFAAAAAAVLVVSVGITALLWNGPAEAPIVAGQDRASDAVLSTWNFEDGNLAPAAVETTAADTGDDGATDDAVFVSDLESGDLGGWTIHS